MAGQNRRAKDQEMAQQLKARGEERRSGRCPTCYRMIPNGLFAEAQNMAHVLNCPGPRRKGRRLQES